uniref:PHD-type domain-containing protein n=1 Tax=Schistocephalus solidus TaxID=70667 RepID=A0A0X3NHW5_SCHSO
MTIAAPVVVCQSQSINKGSVSLVATTEVISLQEAHTDTQTIAPAATETTSAVPNSSNRENSVNDGADVMADIVADLACRVCGRLITNRPDPGGGGNGGGTNAMIECSLCHGLYHQLCHTPPVLGRLPATSLNTWTCSTCSALAHQPEKTSESSGMSSASLSPSPVTLTPTVSRRKRQSPVVISSPRQQRKQ